MKVPEELPQNLSDLRAVSDIAYRISPLARPTVVRSDRQYFGRNLFLHMVYVAGALRQLVEPAHDRDAEWWQRHVDVSSVASLARNLVESYDLFWYMAIETCTEPEWEFRKELWALHYSVEMQHVRSGLEVSQECYPDGSSLHDAIADQSRRILRANPEFSGLPQRVRRRLLRGTRPTIDFKDRLPKWQVIKRSELRGLYKYLSHHTHSHPLAVESRVSLIFHRNLLEPGTILNRAMRCSVQHLSLAVLDYLTKFRRFYPVVPKGERRMLRDILALERRYVADGS